MSHSLVENCIEITPEMKETAQKIAIELRDILMKYDVAGARSIALMSLIVWGAFHSGCAREDLIHNINEFWDRMELFEKDQVKDAT